MMRGSVARKDDDPATSPAQIRTERFAPNVYCIVLSGYFVGTDADRLIAQIELWLAEGGLPHLFFDTEPMTGYRTEFRESMTAWYGRRKDAFGGFNALVRSKVISMAITVANLATRGRIKTYGDRLQFEVAKHSAANDANSRRKAIPVGKAG